MGVETRKKVIAVSKHRWKSSAMPTQLAKAEFSWRNRRCNPIGCINMLLTGRALAAILKDTGRHIL